jgi:exopolyphosphatase
VNTLHIPVCHLYRADLALRPEFAAVLRDANVRSEDVFTLEDVMPPREARNLPASGKDSTGSAGGQGEGTKGEGGICPEDTRWLLVDHNAMTGSLADTFGTRVIGCVDHHADEDVVPRDAEIRVIEKSGSCASLVLERCAEIWGPLGNVTPPGEGEGERGSESAWESAKIDAQLARLAIGPILIDTSNLGDKNKTTTHDERAVALAESKIAAYAELKNGDGGSGARVKKTEEGYDRNALFTRLSGLKEDLSEMSFHDILRKDYKEWSIGGLNLGTSSVPQGFGYLVEEKAANDAAAFLSELGNWGAEKDGDAKGEQKMDLVVVLTAFKGQDGNFGRELLVWARTEAGVNAMKLFEEANKNKLQLGAWRDGKLDLEGNANDSGKGAGLSELRRCWRQGAVEHSRKQIAPMLRDALQEVSSS